MGHKHSRPRSRAPPAELAAVGSSAAVAAEAKPVCAEELPAVRMEHPFRCEDRTAIPDALVEGPFDDFEIAGDVYATAYLIARNATPDMYSIWPWRNPDVCIVWLYLFFIIGSQLFVMVAITLWYPPAVRTETVHVDCANASAVAAMQSRGFLSAADAAECRERGVPAFEADVRGVPITYYALEQSTLFHNAILAEGGVVVYCLRAICCTWVFSQVYLQEFDSVKALLEYHDFSRWFLPLKGEQVRNGWAIVIPLFQYMVLLVVTVVSFIVICAQSEPFDIVMNSLAFTFITEVGGYFNSPLAKRMAATQITGLDASYGTIYYLYPEYRLSNAIREDGSYTDDGWYICEEEGKAGLLSDYKVRHNENKYPRPSQQLIRILEGFLFSVPPAVVCLGALRCGAFGRLWGAEARKEL